jgi:hypothetical protein
MLARPVVRVGLKHRDRLAENLDRFPMAACQFLEQAVETGCSADIKNPRVHFRDERADFLTVRERLSSASKSSAGRLLPVRNSLWLAAIARRTFESFNSR